MENLENKNQKSFIALMNEIDDKQRNQRDRGTLFELLVIAYLKTEPMYARLFEDVWELNNVPEEYKIPKKDTGVDLVAKKKKTGELIAIQCKFYSKDTAIRKEHIDSFLNEVGKQYYSEGLIVTSTDNWSINANDALKNRDKPIARISLSDLQESTVDWSSYSFNKPSMVKLQNKKLPLAHQIPAIEAVVEGFNKSDRGKLIMAPGTGKTFTSLAIAEKMAMGKKDVFRVLYLVPSIQLLSQTLRSWTADTKFNMEAIAVCSDRKVNKVKDESELEDITTVDIGYPATTSYKKLLEYQQIITNNRETGDLLVVFSTYQSIDVIIEAQKNGFYDFDLIVCDEAHRTTGTTENGSDSSAFTKVHNNNEVSSLKRLYQTATPRIYGENAKRKADELSIVISDMNDEEIYGKEFYRIGFADAIQKGILTDYKVMILAVDEEVIARRFQQMFSRESELEFDDVTKIIGCWNGLVKRKNNSDEVIGKPMKRAIAFTGTINESKKITKMFSEVVEHYINDQGDYRETFNIEIEHADGSMNALQKNDKLSWLKGEVPERTCRILSNARFLTEGVDIPDLDAILFLKPRKSKIDIAQAVGRVMRKSYGKDYGYVILPVGIPAGIDPNTALDNNEKYRVVWEVLNALRSLDERFDATINKLELNKNKPDQVQIIGVGDAPENGLVNPKDENVQLLMNFGEEWSELENAIYGKIVRRVGNTRYWEEWSKDVADIAQQHMMRIRIMLENKEDAPYDAFQLFLKGLRQNINGTISEHQAIEMLAQHLITKPVFEALFDSYSFVNDNPISKAMDNVLKVMDEQGLLKEQERLQDFYNSVRIRAEGIDNLKAKQEIIIQLYDKFFKVGFKETTESLGIVFTPVEVVDFIIHSVNDLLSKYFNKSVTNEGVNILDPFTGTGTFMVRLLQSGLISKEDIVRKFTRELHANEIILLSYYIAAINIEETYHSFIEGEYKPFSGIVLTDTFESSEKINTFDDLLFGENNRRLKKQQEDSIYAIIGNPPYNVGQGDGNNQRESISYPILDSSIEATYAKDTKGGNTKLLKDSYIRAFRWASNRLNKNGVIGFVTNGSYIDNPSTDSMRKSLYQEFNYIYVFNLRGDQRTKGEQARKEGGKIFGSGSRTPIALTFLVKDGSQNHSIFYKDIGDYLSREDKLSIISTFGSIKNIDWSVIIPDENNDWINQRDTNYSKFIPFIGEKDSVFLSKNPGIKTHRDPWVYNFSKEQLIKDVRRLIENFNSEVDRLKEIKSTTERRNAINTNEVFIKWSEGLKSKLDRLEKITFDENKLQIAPYRPFTKKWLYFDKAVIEMTRNFDVKMDLNSITLYVSGNSKQEFSTLVINGIPNIHLLNTGQGFLLNDCSLSEGLLSGNSNISQSFKNKIKLNDDEVFYYVYAILHCLEFNEKYQNDLRKTLPKIPILKNKEEFVNIGSQLVNLHLNYESVPMYDNLKIEMKNNPSYYVNKMKHPKKGNKEDKSIIVFNQDITIYDVPLMAYDYIINGKPAIDVIIEQYQITADKNSGIVHNPNLYSDNEKYIFELLLRIINVSIQTVTLINKLPKMELDC